MQWFTDCRLKPLAKSQVHAHVCAYPLHFQRTHEYTTKLPKVTNTHTHTCICMKNGLQVYMVSGLIKGTESFCCEECMEMVIAGGVKVSFQNWESPNGTNESRGQVRDGCPLFVS